MFFSFRRFFFYVPLVLHTIGEDERAFLHCTSSVMLRIPGFYRVRLPPPICHRETSALSASTGPIADCCSEERRGWVSDSLSAVAGRVHVVEQVFV